MGLFQSLGNYISQLDLDTDSGLLANSDSKVTSQKAIRAYIDGKVPTGLTYYKASVLKTGVKIYGETVSITSGSAVIYLTDDHTSGGSALFTEVNYVDLNINDSANIYGRSYTLSGDLKTLTVSVTKQTFTGITLLSTPILGSVTLSAAPNGLSVNVKVEGL